ncbi:MAG TPA: DUF3160 domain-containing protein [Bacteroidota bacterium]|nr:DUF3160 domain-containing protein [Bacteroidota bacterium]
MNSLRSLLFAPLALAVCISLASGQSNPAPELAAYEAFLATHVDMSATQLLGMHPAGAFSAHAAVVPDQLAYFPSIDSSYGLTPYERGLIADHRFMVTDRQQRGSFGSTFLEIYSRDLPVFISTDAILHAIHSSYDAILMSAEEGFLIAGLDSLLGALRSQMPALAAAYAPEPSMGPMLRDIDIYLTVASALLDGSAEPYFTEDAAPVGAIQVLIANKGMSSLTLFSSTPRYMDFSQFTIRGHYTQTPELGRYFQSMIWLGRTEIYLIAPESDGPAPPQTPADIQRQVVDGALLVEAAAKAGAFPLLAKIDNVIRMFVGDPDNVTLPEVQTLLGWTGVTAADQLLDTTAFAAFQDTLRAQPFAFQRILSQILASPDPYHPGKITPASALLLLGQRFVADSYVSGNVVYDKISYQGAPVWRPLPSKFDVLYALGNDAAAQLLAGELDQYHYATNLAAMRYLIDGYDAGFWTSSLYNAWLGMIRACNPPQDRSALPPFMATAAWWQEKMNTQLVSWAELRHDNLLYAKQSYTGYELCSYPRSYVEPLPAFYDAAGRFARTGKDLLVPLLGSVLGGESPGTYFENLAAVSDTLGAIARKELSGTSLSPAETGFLGRMAYQTSMECGQAPSGWYYTLYYDSGKFKAYDYIVADVHTCPSDEFGTPVGWVWHVGTGPVNLAVVAASTPEGCPFACIGPVGSFRECVTSGFLRLTDQQWSTSYAYRAAYRPSFVNIYLADSTGSSRGTGESLLTGAALARTPELPQSAVLLQNYPNPFNPSTTIGFILPRRTAVTLGIYNSLGQCVATLVNGVLDAGYHAAHFDGAGLASGVYFYRLRAGDFVQTKGLVLMK